MPDNWFSYREIAFQDRDCIIFIAENIETLEAGRWPAACAATSRNEKNEIRNGKSETNGGNDETAKRQDGKTARRRAES